MSSKNSEWDEFYEGIAQRLRALRESQPHPDKPNTCLPRTLFAQETGIKESTIEKVEQGKTKAPAKLIYAAARTYGESIEYLVTGTRGDSEKVAEKEPDYDALSDQRLIALLRERLEARKPKEPDAKQDKYADFRLIPYMEGAAAAGAGGVVEEWVQGYVAIHKRALPQGQDVVAVTVDGDSMEPALPDGSIVAIDTTRKNPEKCQGEIVAARTSEGDVVIKRLSAVKRSLILTSDNDQAAPDDRIIEVDPREVEKPIIGQVVWA